MSDTTDKAQEEYWTLSERRAQAQAALWRAEDAMDAFLQAHKGETFKVFRPELLERAINPSIKPLHFDVFADSWW